ncbi:MAG: DNA polymerase/3'-5' exonuclease PolX [Candidatus Aminicenantes bacterium]|nr:DNA polymerase/3'-5' exonuclease PolX [Candidatus Aminicenantes bacterium]
MTKNRELAKIFLTISDALEINGEDSFKVLAYRRAARILENLSESVDTLAAEKRLRGVPGIGKGLADKIEEYLRTGRMSKLKETSTRIPRGLLPLLEVQGLGGKTIRRVWKELGVKDAAGLRRAAADGSLARLSGLGEKRAANILKSLDLRERARERISIFEAVTVAEDILAHLRRNPKFQALSPAGSVRRMKETVGDIDILAAARPGDREELVAWFTGFPGVSRVLEAGETKSSILIPAADGERQVDLRLVDESEYGAALQYFTGSKEHNVKLRGMAKDRGLKISEYGVFRGGKKIAGPTEEEVYRALGLPPIPPEMREDRGEVELALEGRLPRSVEPGDIRGDLHVHSDWSDGRMTLRDIREAGRRLGYAYIAVCDHSRSAAYAGGLSPERLARQGKEIERLNQGAKGFVLLKGAEVDILGDGTLDFPDRILEKLDFVVASIHSGFRKNVTERMIKALSNPLVSTIGHPTGRLISGREGYEVDLKKVMDAARKTGVALELNAFFDRLDLNETHLRQARKLGIKISIGTDTHQAGGLDMMRYGVGIARRAWLSKADILNTLPATGIKKLKNLRNK